MKPLPTTTRLALLALATTLGSLPLHGGTTWDGGATLDTNIDTPANWDADSAPGLAGTVGVLFQSANNVATLNVPVAFRMTGSSPFNPAVAFGANFTLNTTSSNSLTLYGTNSGANNPVLRANSGASAVTINAPIKVFATSPAASPLGSLLTIGVNNATASNTALNITGGISRDPASTAATYDIRYVGASSMTSQAKTKIGGTISGLGTLANIQGGSGIWAGDLIIAGDQASTSTSNITLSSTSPAPTTSARLILGESSADEQTWNNVTLNNVMNLAIGGTITANAFSGNVLNSKITGYGAGGTLSFNSGEIGINVALGGGGTDQNNLSLTKKGSGTLIIRSSSATYTGPTIVEAGTLAVASTASLASPITVQSGATLSSEGATTSSLTFGSGTSTLGFDPATPGSFTAGSVATTGATIIANPSSATSIGTTYTVLTKTSGTFSGSDVAAFVAGGRGTIGGEGTNTITYTGSAASLTWKGNDGTNPTFWDLGTTFNWDNSGDDRFFSNDLVTFDDSASSYAVAIQGASVSPGNMVFDHSANYTVNGGTIVGTGSLTKSGSGTLTLAQASGTNSFGGALQINGGTLSISSLNRIGGSGSSRAIQLGGGTLEYTYTATNAETSDVMPLTLNPGNSTLSITGSYITGSVNAPTAPVTLRLGSAITGSGNLTKSGPGIFAIGKNSAATLGNTFDGTFTVTGGALDIRNPDALGATTAGTTLQNAQLELFSFGQNAGVTFNAEPLTFTGNSFMRAKNEDLDSDIVHEWTGPVTVSASAVAAIAAPKAAAFSSVTPNTINSISPNITTLELSGTVTTGAGSILKLGLLPSVVLPIAQTDIPQTVTLSAALTGSGAVETQGEATSLYTLADPEYSGDTTVNGGILSLGATNSANDSSSVSIAATGATLDLNFSGSDDVGTLFIGGVQKAAGIWGSVASGAPNNDPSLTGTGTLTVASGPAVSAFGSWIAGSFANGTVPGGQQGVNDDPDADGASNLVEFAFDGDPTSGANNGKIHVFTVDTDHDGETANAELVLTAAVRSTVGAFTGATAKSASVDGITYTIEGSTTLDPFTTQVNNVPTAVPPSPATLSSGYVWKSFSLDGSNGLPGKGFLRAKVTAP
jgi:autotransporter-associated beta strand protein